MVTDCKLEDMTDQFITRRRYRGDGCWTCQTRKEEGKMTGQGDFVLGMSRHPLSKEGGMEAQMHTDHRMVLVVL